MSNIFNREHKRKNHHPNLAGRLPWMALLLAAFLVLIFLPLFQKGTFIDGLLYKTVAFNYAENSSGFWSMKFTETSMQTFCEQPPLYFFLLGMVYKVFPNLWLADHLFTLALWGCLLWVIYRILKRSIQAPVEGFLHTVLLLLSIPVFCWSYANQVIEPLVCLLLALAILFFVQYTRQQGRIFLFLFSATVILLFLSKGFQSCFVMALPFFYIFFKKWNTARFSFAILSALIVGVTLSYFLFLYPPAVDWFSCYYQSRLVLTMQNTGATTTYHAEIIWRFVTELIPILLLSLFAFVYVWKRKAIAGKQLLLGFYANPLAMALLLTSLLGVLPFAISLVQRGFYLLPGMLCFVLSLVIGFNRPWIFCYRALGVLANKTVTRVVSLLVLAVSLMVLALFVSSYKKDEQLLNDLQQIEAVVNKGDSLGVNENEWNNFSMHAYLYLHKKINLSSDKDMPKRIIRVKGTETLADSTHYQPVPLNTNTYGLWVKR